MMPLLQRYVFDWMFQHGVQTVYAAAAFPFPGSLFVRMGLTRLRHEPFKYEERDPVPVSLLTGALEDYPASPLIAMTDRLVRGEWVSYQETTAG